MDKRIILLTKYVLEEPEIEIVSELNAKFNEYGLFMEYNAQADYFVIEFDTEAFERKTRRGAGAKTKSIGKIISLTVLRERIAASSAQEVADELGVSRSTLYRRIKEAEKIKDDDVYL